MNKIELKSLIKECILEILTEGLGNQISERKILSPVKKNSLNDHKQKLDEKIKIEEQRLKKHRENLDRIKFSDNNLMNDILSETAKTSFLERERAEVAIRTGGVTAIPGIPNNPEVIDPEGGGIDLDFLDRLRNKKVDWSEIAGIK